MTNDQGQRKWLGVLLVSLSLISGIAAGFFWHSFRSGEVVRPIERNVLISIYVDDKNCDSGLTTDWFNGAKFVNEIGETITSISNLSLDSCSKEFEFYMATALVRPGRSWAYRLVLYSDPEKTSDSALKLRTIVGLKFSDTSEVWFSVSTDCTNNERFCNS